MAVRELPKYESSRDDYIYVDNVANFAQRMLKVDNVPDILAADTETHYDSSLRAPQAICKWIQGNKNNAPFGASFYTGTQGYWVDHNLQDLSPLLMSPIEWAFHNAKYDLNMLMNIGLNITGHIWDTMIMIQLINEELMCRLPIDEDGIQKYKKTKALKHLAYHFLGQDAHQYEDLVKEYRTIIAANTGRKVDEVSYKEANDANPILMKDYAVSDTEYTYKLQKLFLPMLKEQNLLGAYDIDMNATYAVIDMERNGYLVDAQQMKQDEQALTSIIENISHNIYKICGSTFNINSDKELVDEFEKLGMKWSYFTDKDELCTDKRVMKELGASENTRIAGLAKEVLLHRKASKILSTYVTGILQYIQEDGRVHCDYWVSPNDFGFGSTVTGRLSSSNPNMQNITKKPIVFDLEDTEDIEEEF